MPVPRMSPPLLLRLPGLRRYARRFGLVHIDVDVYPIVKFCLEFFGPRVVAGATVIMDDYGFKTCPGAKRAVDEFTATSPHFRMVHLLTGQALLIRLAA